MPDPTAAFPGPDPGVIEMLGKIERLELVARRNASSLLAGDYETAIPGQGLLFHETRKYVPGEPARRIDWNITARLGEPYVKVHLEERRRNVMIALDVSPSMHTGFQSRTKLEFAVELAATLAASAVDAGDRLGLIVFADEVLATHRPAGGERQLFEVLRTMLERTVAWSRPVAESNPRAAVRAVEEQGAQRFVVFVISDFIDHDIPEDLKYVRARHDVSLLHVYDPVEYGASNAVRFRARSPEAGVDGRRGPKASHLSPGETGSLEEIETFLRVEAARYGIGTASLSTAEPVAAALGRFFHAKRARVVR